MKPQVSINDQGNVRLGAMSPNFPPVRMPPPQTADSRKVRLGGMAPVLPVREPNARILDTSKVRLGGMAPLL
jgi:hypothetical protein